MNTVANAEHFHFRSVRILVEEALNQAYPVVYPVEIFPNPRAMGLILRAGVGDELVEQEALCTWTVDEFYEPGQTLNLNYSKVRSVLGIKNLVTVAVPLPLYLKDIDESEILTSVFDAINEAKNAEPGV